jgi:predicted O-linked N-acetylglucosamine transferase (SPINDLY family)/ADP-heptose:LPS heptosyltransferase/2-polyprenyl-3-methyl-5-hydroxy-6-metoxy-1,4-benzoquinol methylase
MTDTAAAEESTSTPASPTHDRCWCGGELGERINPLYRRCTRCGTACLLRRPGENDLQKFYSMQGYWHDHQVNVVHFPPIEERAANDFRDRIPVWFNMLKGLKPDVKSLLEIGCAHGGFLSYSRERGVDRVVGVEVDAGTCEFARKRFNLPHVEAGLFPEVKLPPGKYDAVCGFDVAEHFLQPIQAMEAVRDLLEDDGVFLFQTPWYRGQDVNWGQFKPSEHIFLYTHSSMRRLMQAAGLELICVLPGLFPDDMFAAGRKKKINEVVCLRTDSIGDHAMAAPMLPKLADAFQNARLTMVCQEHLKEMYENCPHVGNVVTYDKQRAYAEVPYREELAQRIKSLAPDLCLNPVYSREPLGDFLALSTGATYRFGHNGDTCNLDPASKQQNDPMYSLLVPQPQQAVPEAQHHIDFCRILGIDLTADEATQPMVWTAKEDEEFADEMFKQHDLDPNKTIALFAGAQFPVKDYDQFGTALTALCENEGYRVIALGTAREADLNRRNLEALPPNSVDLSTRTTIRQSAEILRRCRLAVGTDTGLAHIACAVGTRNVILLGGGHFGRFLPYSPLTTIVCLPIECYGCNWVCRYQRPHCVRDVSAQVMEHAIRITLDAAPGTKPRVVAQDRSLWKPPQGGPMWSWFHGMLSRGSIDLVTVGQRDAEIVDTKIAPPRRHTWGWPHSQQGHAQRLAAARACLQAGPQQLPSAVAQARPLLQDVGVVDLPASVEERMFVDEVLSGLARGESDPYALNYRAAAMLYFRMHELPAWDAARIPAWLMEDFVPWTVQAPGLFYEIGEKDEYHRRMEAWFTFVKHQLEVAREHPLSQRLAEMMTIRPNLIPAYFTSANLKLLLSTRADIIESYVSNLALDYSPERYREGEKIRVGIVKNHWAPGTETYATLPLFEHLPRDRFEVSLYALEPTGLPAEAHCKSKADRFVILPNDLMQQVNLLRGDKLHFFFYAMNMTAVTHNLVPLAMFRLAPVQATSICSPATSGMSKMDVFLAGELTENRPDAQDQYREKLVKLPGSGICFDYTLRPPPSAFAISREQLKLDPSTIVFTSGANFYKVIPELRRAWVRLLAATSNTVLMLYPFGPAWTNSYPAGSFIRCFEDELRAAGVEPTRLVLLNPMDSPSDVRKLMAITDIYVDSFPYTGATSLLDPLEAGVPPITMAGDRLRFGQGDALLRELGMPELIATSEEHYIEVAAELARDRELLNARRAAVKEKMRERPPFLDTQRFCGNVARVIEELVRRPPSPLVGEGGGER